MPDIELLDEGGKAKELSTIERVEAIKIAIDCRDPKLVQLLCGARYCQLWQYWLVRSLFNYDMLSMVRIAKCELPLAIYNEQLRYLADKEHIDVAELSRIQSDKKIEYCRKIQEFYGDGDGRILEIMSSIGSQTECTSNQFADRHLQGYSSYNMGVSVPDSITAAVNADFSPECESMINRTINECEQEVMDAAGSVSKLTTALREKIVKLESRGKDVSSKIKTVSEGIIKKMQDSKFVDKDFVQSEYDKLLDYYFESLKYLGDAATDEERNPLHKYINSEEMINEAKKSLRKSNLYYGFGDCIDHAADKIRNETIVERKEAYLNIVRVLAVNGAHSESLIGIFDTEELRKLAQQSIFTVVKKACEVLFDFDRSEESKFMTTIVGESGKFADPVDQNVRIFVSSGTQLVKVILDKLRLVEEELQEKRKSGKANRETGLVNAIYYMLSDVLGSILSEECEAQSKADHAKVYRILYETLDIIYLAMSTGDDRVVIDFAEEIESRIKTESNRDIVDIYSVLNSLCKDYRAATMRGDLGGDIDRWQRFWYLFQGFFRETQHNVREDRMRKSIRIALYCCEFAEEKYMERQRQRFTYQFRNIDVQFLPGNCLINWLAVTKEGMVRNEEENEKQKEKDLAQKIEEVTERFNRQTERASQADLRVEQEAYKHEQEARRADQAVQRANTYELTNRVMKLIRGSMKKLRFDIDLWSAVAENEENITEKVVQHIRNHISDPQQVLSAVMEEIMNNRDQVIEEVKVIDEIIERSIERLRSTE